jgi:uncharacterized membrane protein
VARNKTIKRYGNTQSAQPSRHLTLSASTFSGPLPPPDVLAKYEQTLPGLAGRIVALTEQQSAHRRALESQHLTGTQRAQLRGQNLAFLIVIAGMISGTTLLLLNKPIGGYTAMLTPLTGVAIAFLMTRHSQQEELARKRAELEAAAGQSQ